MGKQGCFKRNRHGATKVEYALVSSTILIVACVFGAASSPAPQLFDRVAVDLSDATHLESSHQLNQHPVTEGKRFDAPLVTADSAIGTGPELPLLTLGAILILLLACTWFVLKLT